MKRGRISLTDGSETCLDSAQLETLERSFRLWADTARGEGVRVSRGRILLIFLLIRYTGAKLSEVLGLNPASDINAEGGSVTFRASGADESREVLISSGIARELGGMLRDLGQPPAHMFSVDPAFVRRKFYERACACGFLPKLGGPEMIRRARAVELMRGNLPLPAVQRLLGHSSPNLTSAYAPFSDEEMRTATHWFIERESGRRTSARNSFFGKVRSLRRDEVQTLVELAAHDGESVFTMVTNTSAERLGLRRGRLVTAEVKAPWLTLERCDVAGVSSAENRREGIIFRVIRGVVNTECSVRVADGTELCAVVSTPGFDRLGLAEGDPARVLFPCYAVTLHAE